jgi:hypothetical protein
MVKRSLSWGPFWIRRRLQRLRMRLGLPAALSCRAVLLILLALVGLMYLSIAVLSEFTTMKRYAPQFYEPKDFDRGLDAQRKKP